MPQQLYTMNSMRPPLMQQFKVYPYKMSSTSSTTLSTQLQALRLRQNSRTYRPKSNHIIINWGNSQDPSWREKWLWTPNRPRILNFPSQVRIASNKLETFKRLQDNRLGPNLSGTEGDETNINIPTPEWTTSTYEAKTWMTQGHIVFGRETLTGHSGQGIHLYKPEEDAIVWTDCPLYTKYTKCKHEYRVHVMNNEVIDFVMKKKKEGIETNPYVSNHRFGWIFAREGVELPTCVKEAALGAIEALGLDFGAVDIGYKVNEDKAFVYEVNTAPGLEGTTLDRYIDGFRRNYAI